MLLRSSLLLLLCSCVCALYPQSIIPRFETIGVNEGLSQSSVYSILQDRQGFMWFGTADGLNRFDGTETKIYKAKDAVSRGNSNFVRGKLSEDAQGNIWYANETGIYYYHRLKDSIETARTFNQEQSGNSMFCPLGIDRQQRLWMMNTILGIGVYTIGTGEFSIHPLPAGFDKRYGYATAAEMDAQANVWLTFY
jgi:ligand-binding sensor domain-containing protein